MEVGRRRSTARNGVAAGSVWESRMKSDEVKGGFKVFNGEESSEESSEKKLKPKQSLVGVSGKRKTWKSENSEGNPIQIARQKPEQSKNLDEQCKDLSSSSEVIKRSPVQKKTRSEMGKDLSVSSDGTGRSPNQKSKPRYEESKEISVSIERIEKNTVQIRKAKSESADSEGNERNSVQLRKTKSEPNKALDESVDANDKNPVPLTKAKSLTNKMSIEPAKDEGLKEETVTNSTELKSESNNAVDEPVEAIEKCQVGIKETGSEENCKEFGVCEEKVISSCSSNPDAGRLNSDTKLVANGGHGGDDDEDEDWDEELDEEVDEEIEIEIEKKGVDVKEISVSVAEQKPKQVVNEVRKLNQIRDNKPLAISTTVKKQTQTPTSLNFSRIHTIPPKTKAVPVRNGFQRSSDAQTEFKDIPETHNKLQSLVDLVMWRDVSKSAFVFGIGTFLIISSSYTKDLNISLISVVSYLGLVYLAAIFLFRSIICRGVIDVDDTSQCYVVGEEEAVWLLKMVLPFLNEFLLKLRALFSGDPATTMKLAVLLFVLARCGSSITIWKMAKLGFFGVFTVPKICSSYSAQLTAYGKFWIRRFQDAWESCSHKKAVAFGIFALVWNLSSVVARIWAVFMLFVAFRYYHQSGMKDEWVEEEPKCDTSWQGENRGPVRGPRPTPSPITRKEKKRF
ncbi:hypothetical protein NMG60_11013099 [Bertholletia excelsa]